MAVRDSCAPVLACQGHPWPDALDCDRFPAEEDMCLSPHAKFNHFAKGMYGPQTNYLFYFTSGRMNYQVLALLDFLQLLHMPYSLIKLCFICYHRLA